jgi:hypothetical protein
MEMFALCPQWLSFQVGARLNSGTSTWFLLPAIFQDLDSQSPTENNDMGKSYKGHCGIFANIYTMCQDFEIWKLKRKTMKTRLDLWGRNISSDLNN